MRLVGLTGGIATGKSTVSQLLRQTGLSVIDCDEIAREVVEPGRWGWKRVCAAFGNDVLREDGTIDRELLGQLIFKDPRSRAKLNKATHLPVFVELAKRIFFLWLSCETVVIVDMPLLFETGAHRWFFPTILVWCDEETQLKRLMLRDKCEEEVAKTKMQAQMSMIAKSEMSTALINNGSTLSSTKIEVNALTLQLRREQLPSYAVCPIAIVGYLIMGYATVTHLWDKLLMTVP